MSVREEDRQKNSCPSRGLGIAVAAIGVGVGAALYYFFNKRQETPNSEGSTSDWQCEQPQTFEKTDSDDSYTTISEHETTDTSINRTESLDQSEDSEESEHSETSEHSESSDSSSDDLETSDSEINDVFMGDSTMESGYSFFQNAVTSALETDSEMDWDVTTSSVGVPEDPGHSSFASLLGRISTIISPRKKVSEEQQMAILRQEAFRERSWTLEECSICFDVMLRNQEVTSLPCTHNFHTDCIMPWLQEKQTCPNCRKVA